MARKSATAKGSVPPKKSAPVPSAKGKHKSVPFAVPVGGSEKQQARGLASPSTPLPAPPPPPVVVDPTLRWLVRVLFHDSSFQSRLQELGSRLSAVPFSSTSSSSSSSLRSRTRSAEEEEEEEPMLIGDLLSFPLPRFEAAFGALQQARIALGLQGDNLEDEAEQEQVLGCSKEAAERWLTLLDAAVPFDLCLAPLVRDGPSVGLKSRLVLGTLLAQRREALLSMVSLFRALHLRKRWANCVTMEEFLPKRPLLASGKSIRAASPGADSKPCFALPLIVADRYKRGSAITPASDGSSKKVSWIDVDRSRMEGDSSSWSSFCEELESWLDQTSTPSQSDWGVLAPLHSTAHRDDATEKSSNSSSSTAKRGREDASFPLLRVKSGAWIFVGDHRRAALQPVLDRAHLLLGLPVHLRSIRKIRPAPSIAVGLSGAAVSSEGSPASLPVTSSASSASPATATPTDAHNCVLPSATTLSDATRLFFYPQYTDLPPAEFSVTDAVTEDTKRAVNRELRELFHFRVDPDPLHRVEEESSPQHPHQLRDDHNSSNELPANSSLDCVLYTRGDTALVVLVGDVAEILLTLNEHLTAHSLAPLPNPNSEDVVNDILKRRVSEALQSHCVAANEYLQNRRQQQRCHTTTAIPTVAAAVVKLESGANAAALSDEAFSNALNETATRRMMRADALVKAAEDKRLKSALSPSLMVCATVKREKEEADKAEPHWRMIGSWLTSCQNRTRVDAPYAALVVGVTFDEDVVVGPTKPTTDISFRMYVAALLELSRTSRT